jgi:hypothetical protein
MLCICFVEIITPRGKNKKRKKRNTFFVDEKMYLIKADRHWMKAIDTFSC